MIPREDPSKVVADVEAVLRDPGLTPQLRSFWCSVLDAALVARGGDQPEPEPAPDGAPEGFTQRRQQSVI